MDVIITNAYITLAIIVFFAILLCVLIWAIKKEEERQRELMKLAEEKRKKRDTVHETSVLLKKLSELNSKYPFHLNLQGRYVYRKSLPTKPKFDRYEISDFFDECILKNSGLRSISDAFLENRKLNQDYSDKIRELKSEITEEQAENLHIPLEEYQKIEREFFTERVLRPFLDCEIECVVSYDSPQGRNHYSKSEKYRIDDVIPHFNALQQRIALQNSEEAKRKRARSQMTDKLRYTILKRDGFRCVLCGRGRDDGAQLEVDHIFPVSKGGETVPKNLRTLCKECNRGKRDEIEETSSASMT